MHIDGEVAPVCPGQVVYIPPGARQFIRNIGQKDLVFLCIVTPPWKEDDEELAGEPGTSEGYASGPSPDNI